ncbi:MAG: response regulator [Clostridiaceae bacterium]|nr:response regulator [Clostridiaceae bacterium]
MYKIFIVEDEFLVREGIRNKINWENTRFVLSGEASDGEMALAMIQEIKPDILVTDIRMPFMDGLELSRIVKRTLPWIHIIILSGHDEFEYAREAISIGVDEYILKPINSSILLSTLEKVAQSIEEEKKKQLDVELLQMQLKSTNNLIIERFLEELVIGAVNTPDAIKKSHSLGIDILAKRYVVIEGRLDFEGTEYNSIAKIRANIGNLLKDRTDIIWFFRSYDRLVLIIKGETAEAVIETAYQVSQVIRYETERNKLGIFTIGIGSVAERIGAIPESYSDAVKVHSLLGNIRKGHIVGIKDIESGEISTSTFMASEAPVSEKLRYASKEDIPYLINQWTRSMDKSNFQTALMGYYFLMDVLMAAARMINELGGDYHHVLPEVDNPAKLFEVACNKENFTSFVEDVIKRTIDFRDSCENLKYGRIIHKAKEFINANYHDSGISLNTVAAVVSLSPNHFSTIFSQETGETFIEYLTRIRIENAKKLLIEGSMKTTDIAYAVGYNEAHYFSYIFKKNTGLTPREFKAKMQPQAIAK